MSKQIKFWRWFSSGCENSPSGLTQMFWGDIWTVACSATWLIVSGILTCFTPEDIMVDELAKEVMSPLIGILIGAFFAGATIVMPNIKKEEVINLISLSEKNVEDYIFGVQGIAFVLLLSIGYCALMATGFTSNLLRCEQVILDDILKFFIYISLFVSLWQSWRMVNFSIALTHLQIIMHQNEMEEEDNTNP